MTRALFPILVALGLGSAGCVASERPWLPPLDLARVTSSSRLEHPSAIAADASARPTDPLLIDLPSALAVSGARSVEVRYAEAKTDEARQAYYGAGWSFLPTIGPGIQMRVHRGIVQKATGEFVDDIRKQAEQGGVGGVLQWQPGGAIFRALAAARRADAAHAATDTARAESALQVAEAYYRLVRARAIVRIAIQAVEEARELARTEDLKERRGAGIRADVLRAQAELSLREVALTQVESDTAVTSARLAALLQLEPDVELVPADETPLPVSLVSGEIALSALLEKAQAARPELRESELLIEAAEKDREGTTWGPLVPQVDAGAQSAFFGPTFGQGEPTNDAAVALGWRIGPGGLFDFPAMNAAAARERQSRIRDEGLRVEIGRQVVEARARALAAEREIAAARNGVAAAQEALRLSKDRFAKGAGIVLEVLDAQRALTRAQTGEVEAIVDQNRAQYRLLRAIGEPIQAVRPPR